MRSWRNIKTVITISIALGWWSVWFPEMAVWADAVRVVEAECTGGSEELAAEVFVEGAASVENAASVEGATAENVFSWEKAGEIGKGLSHAQPEQIVIKSRLLMLLREQWQERGEK